MAKKKVQYRAVADRSHPLSPWRLGRNEVPRYLWSEVQDDSLRTVRECKEVGEKMLKQGLMAGVEVQFDGLPHPRLQERDTCRIQTDSFSATFPMKRFTIPLVAGENSAYGYLRRMSPKGRRKPIRNKSNKNKNSRRDSKWVG